jgi:S-adenosylmethionine decarboxylase proenzyme
MKHLIGRVSGVCIKTVEELEPLMTDVASQCQLTVVNKAFHQFEPFGVTGVLVLSESHFSAHTYPEHETVYVDIFCCSEHFDPERAGSIILNVFGASTAEWTVVSRA